MIQKLRMGSLPSPYHRCKKLHFRPLRHGHDAIHHLVDSLTPDLSSALGTVRDSHSCIEKSEIIVNFRHSSHCGAGVPVGGLLVYGNRRGESFNALHIRFLHLSQELSCVRRKRLHVTPLSFCIYRIKCQRRLTRTAQARKHHKLISRYIHA